MLNLPAFLKPIDLTVHTILMWYGFHHELIGVICATDAGIVCANCTVIIESPEVINRSV